MDIQRRTLRFCSAVMVCAVLFRLLSGGLLGKMVKALSSPEVISFLLYLLKLFHNLYTFSEQNALLYLKYFLM